MKIPIEEVVFDDLNHSNHDGNLNENHDNSRLHFPVYVSYCAAQPAMDQRLKQLRFIIGKLMMMMIDDDQF